MKSIKDLNSMVSLRAGHKACSPYRSVLGTLLNLVFIYDLPQAYPRDCARAHSRVGKSICQRD